MKNGNKGNYPQATILLDKLIFSCTSLVEDNFDYVVTHEPEYLHYNFQFGSTKLTKTQDPSSRYRHSYSVHYCECLMGTIDFSLYNNGIYTNMLRFTVENEIFYNNNLKYLQMVLSNLNLEINNFTKIDIAIDSYDFNLEQFLRSNLKNKENTIKLFGKIIKDRNKVLNQITYYNHGSLNNPFKIRSILIKNKKRTFELECYDKTDEIKISGKDYILEYHKLINPNLKKIYRQEVRLYYDEIRRYIQKHKKPILLEDLINSNFLFKIYEEYLHRIMTIYKSYSKKKEKVSLLPNGIIKTREGILQPTLPEVGYEVEINMNSKIDFPNINKDSNIEYNKNDAIYSKEIIANNQFNNNSNYEKRQKLIRSNQTKNQQFIERMQKSQLWQTPFART